MSFSCAQRGAGHSKILFCSTWFHRLTPSLAGLIVFCTLILPGLGGGPMWGLVIEPHATLCRQYWWRNMLYIHNYFGFENMVIFSSS